MCLRQAQRQLSPLLTSKALNIRPEDGRCSNVIGMRVAVDEVSHGLIRNVLDRRQEELSQRWWRIYGDDAGARADQDAVVPAGGYPVHSVGNPFSVVALLHAILQKQAAMGRLTWRCKFFHS
jgi:hypothetical protein